MHPTGEVQFTADGGLGLAEALRAALQAEGQPPSRRRVASWITEGLVRVEGEVVRDPKRVLGSGERVDLRPPPEGETDPHPARSTPGTSIRHLDRHLVVATYDPPAVVAPDATAVTACLRRCLEEAGFDAPSPLPVPVPEPRASGLVAAALSPAAAERLREAFATGAAALDVVAVVASGPGTLAVRLGGRAGIGDVLTELEGRDLEVLSVPGPGPFARKPLLLHVGALRLPHPRSGRSLAWSCPPPPALAAALAPAIDGSHA